MTSPCLAADATPTEAPQALTRLTDVIGRLLAPDGCPWDKEQTPASLTEYLIEECFELVDAIRHGTPADVREELGDVLFLTLLVSRLHEDKGDFTLTDVLNTNAAKMVRRHPHVFADTQLEDRAALMANWERIKRAEKAANDGADTPAPDSPHDAGSAPAPAKSVFASLPRALPPLTKSYRIHAKAAGVGFTWPEDEEVERQVEAEWLELLDARVQGDEAAVAREFGDHLFSLVEFGRRNGIKAAMALDAAAGRFLERFARMEDLARARGLDFTSLSLDDKDVLWEEIKQAEKATS